MYSRLKGQPQTGIGELPTIENILAKPNADRKTVEIGNLPNGVYCQILYPIYEGREVTGSLTNYLLSIICPPNIGGHGTMSVGLGSQRMVMPSTKDTLVGIFEKTDDGITVISGVESTILANNDPDVAYYVRLIKKRKLPGEGTLPLVNIDMLFEILKYTDIERTYSVKSESLDPLDNSSSFVVAEGEQLSQPLFSQDESVSGSSPREEVNVNNLEISNIFANKDEVEKGIEEILDKKLLKDSRCEQEFVRAKRLEAIQRRGLGLIENTREEGLIENTREERREERAAEVEAERAAEMAERAAEIATKRRQAQARAAEARAAAAAEARAAEGKGGSKSKKSRKSRKSKKSKKSKKSRKSRKSRKSKK